MLLRNWLKKADCKTVKIGYQKGSQFVYCGRIDNSKLTETLELTSKRYREYQIKRLARLKQEIKDVEYELSLPEQALNRQVVEEYPSIAEEGQVIIAIEGINNGTYWDISEFEKGEEDEEI